MLIKGDLVRLPQGTVVVEERREDHALSITQQPEYAIIVDTSTDKEFPDNVKVLIDNKLMRVNKRKLQLIGGA